MEPQRESGVDGDAEATGDRPTDHARTRCQLDVGRPRRSVRGKDRSWVEGSSIRICAYEGGVIGFLRDGDPALLIASVASVSPSRSSGSRLADGSEARGART